MYYLCLKVTFSCQFLMVTGGWDGSTRLDSTEIFSDSVWRTVAGKLPEAMVYLFVATITNRVLLFGKLIIFDRMNMKESCTLVLLKVDQEPVVNMIGYWSSTMRPNRGLRSEQ